MNKKEKQFKPVSKKERINLLDALRGFAIFGIFIINIRTFSGYSYATPEMNNDLLLKEWDTYFNWLHSVFFSGKFYTLFSLLFGIGFAIQLVRASSSDRSFIAFYSRRLFFLLLIGLVHLWGIWFSDILVIYAICGYLLILFKGLSNRGLLWSFVLFLLLTGLHDWYLHVYSANYNFLYQLISDKWSTFELPTASAETKAFQMPDITEVIRDGSWNDVLKFNAIGPLLRGYFIAFDARLIKVLAIFLLGFWVGRKILFNKLHENRPFLIKTAIVGWLLGLSLNIYYVPEVNTADDPLAVFLKGVLEPVGYISLTSAYAATFALLYLGKLTGTFNRLFSSVGKTALSNYILQSFAGIALFYSIGLGLGKYFGSTLLTVSVFVIFIFQVLISNLWLKYHRYGPLEWLWRALTYGQHIKKTGGNNKSSK